MLKMKNSIFKRSLVIILLISLIMAALLLVNRQTEAVSDTYNEDGLIEQRELNISVNDENRKFVIINSGLSSNKINKLTDELKIVYKKMVELNDSPTYTPPKKIMIELNKSNLISYAQKNKVVLYNMYSDNYLLVHELSHTLFGFGNSDNNEFYGNYGFLTQEGLAVFLQFYLEPDKSVFPNNSVNPDKIVKYLKGKQEVISLSKLGNPETAMNYFSIEGNTQTSYETWISYVEAGSFIQFIINQYSFEELFKIYNTENLEASVSTVLNKSLTELEEEWLTYIDTSVSDLSQQDKDNIIFFIS
ncbi:gluzincin family metallopeptidase [Niallia taxi]|nr:hypothetical protein [Niallia taxi]